MKNKKVMLYGSYTGEVKTVTTIQGDSNICTVFIDSYSTDQVQSLGKLIYNKKRANFGLEWESFKIPGPNGENFSQRFLLDLNISELNIIAGPAKKLNFFVKNKLFSGVAVCSTTKTEKNLYLFGKVNKNKEIIEGVYFSKNTSGLFVCGRDKLLKKVAIRMKPNVKENEILMVIDSDKDNLLHLCEESQSDRMIEDISGDSSTKIKNVISKQIK